MFYITFNEHMTLQIYKVILAAQAFFEALEENWNNARTQDTALTIMFLYLQNQQSLFLF